MGVGVIALRLGFRQVKGLKAGGAGAAGRAPGPGLSSISPELRRRPGSAPPRSTAWRAPMPSARSRSTGAAPCGARSASIAPATSTTCRPCSPGPRAGRRRAEPEVALPPMTLGHDVAEDYANLRLSLRAHPLALLRRFLAAPDGRGRAARRPRRWPPGRGRGPDPGPPAPGHRERGDLHHARGRDRGRQSGGLAQACSSASAGSCWARS